MRTAGTIRKSDCVSGVLTHGKPAVAICDATSLASEPEKVFLMESTVALIQPLLQTHVPA
jgi:hypothetical protein